MASTITQVEKLVGKRIRRREDPRLITGTATYVDDIQMPGMHYAAIVRSPHAAARIRSIDTKAAAETPSVAAIYTGKDTAKVGPSPICNDAGRAARVAMRRTALAQSSSCPCRCKWPRRWEFPPPPWYRSNECGPPRAGCEQSPRSACPASECRRRRWPCP